MFFDVSVSCTRIAVKTIRVEADDKDKAEEKARDMAGDEDWTGCVADYDFDVTNVVQVDADGNPVPPSEQCVFCGKEMPDDMDQVADEGWHPCYWEGDKQQDGPACPACLAKYCTLDGSGEFVLNEIKGEFVSFWGSGHEFRSACTVNPAARTVTVLQSHETGNDVEGLLEEYVLLDGEKFPARHADQRKDFSAQQQRQMFFYE